MCMLTSLITHALTKLCKNSIPASDTRCLKSQYQEHQTCIYMCCDWGHINWYVQIKVSGAAIVFSETWKLLECYPQMRIRNGIYLVTSSMESRNIVATKYKLHSLAKMCECSLESPKCVNVALLWTATECIGNQW